MSFEWIEMRITEEQDRRKREMQIKERMPVALAELHSSLMACVESYTATFGAESADVHLFGTKIRAVVREERDDGRWEQTGKIEVITRLDVPGFQVDRATTDPLIIEVGLLPGDRLCYRDLELDKYLTVEEMTRRILDRALFPKLGE